MPKYTTDIIAGYTLYFTSKCIIEAMHVHASTKELAEHNSAKLYVYENGDTKIVEHGSINDIDMHKIRSYIKLNHAQMYKKWSEYSENGYYNKE